MICLLCDSDKVIVKESYLKEDLAMLWRGMYPNIDLELKLDEVVVYQCKNCSLKFFDPRLAGGDDFYSELGKQDWYYLHPGKTEYDYVQKYIKNGDEILDIGAGRGVLFTKIKTKVNYTGLELSTRAVELAQESNINVKKEDLLKHAYENQFKYDIVCLFQVLEHLTSLEDFIKSIQLALKSEGLFVIAVPDNDGFISNIPDYTFNLPPHHTILWTETSLRYLAKKYDFEIVEIEREVLQDVHRENAYKAYLISFFGKIFFLPKQLLKRSHLYEKISFRINQMYENRMFGRFIMPIVKWRQKYGQSIIVTFRKKI